MHLSGCLEARCGEFVLSEQAGGAGGSPEGPLRVPHRRHRRWEVCGCEGVMMLWLVAWGDAGETPGKQQPPAMGTSSFCVPPGVAAE